MRILITGSDGLIGGAAVEYFDALGHEVHGADNNMRKQFFGDAGNTEWNRHRIFHGCKNYHPNDTDITNVDQVWSLFHRGNERPALFRYDAIIHCAAQPSHDKASRDPQLDYDVNVRGTYNLLEAARKFNPGVVFIFMSTNKVYDDFVNDCEYEENDTRYDLVRPGRKRGYYWSGFDESIPVGAANVFGSHKLEADLLVQDYTSRGLKTMVLRGGCLTGPGHSGVPLHGFLNYLIRCAASGTTYQILGYRGKQVRDNLHSYDVARAFDEIIRNPRPGEVYNLGGGRENSISVLEAIEKAEKITGKKMSTEYVETPRSGDHQCYITDMTKFRHDYPNWYVSKSLDDIFNETFRQYYWGTYSDHEDTKTYDLNENSIVFDVGGYRGAFTQSIVDKYNPYVIIFEPVQEFCSDCRRRFADNPKVEVHQFGLSDGDETSLVAKQGMNSSSFRGLPGQTALPVDSVYGAAQPETIQLVDIRKYLSYTSQDVDLISMNCEGGEYDIMMRLLDTGLVSRFANIQIQFHDFHPDAVALRHEIRERLKATHEERFNYPFVWESWKRKKVTT